LAKKKKKGKKQYNNWDKVSFEKREMRRAKLKKQRIYTKSFYTQQSFGAASDAIILNANAYVQAHPEIISGEYKGKKNETK
jgi:hypothetical protein